MLTVNPLSFIMCKNLLHFCHKSFIPFGGRTCIHKLSLKIGYSPVTQVMLRMEGPTPSYHQLCIRKLEMRIGEREGNETQVTITTKLTVSLTCWCCSTPKTILLTPSHLVPL